VPFNVTIRNLARTVEVDEGETILEAALLAGIDYPCGCQSGNCGACKSELVSGEVDMIPYSDFALLPEERASGLILACRSVPWSDCEVAWAEPDEVAAHASRVMTCRVASIERMTHDVRRLRLEVESGGPFDFSAGQYARIVFDRLPPRDFSMANRPDEAVLEFHVRLLDGGVVSRYVADSLEEGEDVRVEGPMGVSYLREAHRGPIIAIAGSTGLAPILSIVETALAKRMPQPIHLYFGVRDERDLYCMDRLQALAAQHDNLSFVPVLSEPESETARRTGFVTDAVLGDFDDLDGAKAYIAGPPAMVEAAVPMLERLGVRRADCHYDAFYTEAEKAAVGGAA
jgi:ferredoxin-NAD(P)+ reductase (naphthalene dioxygenase ferredoxin-specific)